MSHIGHEFNKFDDPIDFKENLNRILNSGENTEDDFNEEQLEDDFDEDDYDDEPFEDDFDEDEDEEESPRQSEITGVLVDVKITGKARTETIRNELPEYYRILDCSCFDIVSVKIGQHFYDVYCDDESLLKANPIVSAVDKNCSPQLTGNLFITKTDFDGETLSLEPHEIKEVTDQIKGFFDLAAGKAHDVLICEL